MTKTLISYVLNQQLHFPLFTSGPLRKQKLTSAGFKRSCLSVVIGGFGSILSVSVFQALLTATITIIASSKKCSYCFLGFELHSLCY